MTKQPLRVIHAFGGIRHFCMSIAHILPFLAALAFDFFLAADFVAGGGVWRHEEGSHLI